MLILFKLNIQDWKASFVFYETIEAMLNLQSGSLVGLCSIHVVFPCHILTCIVLNVKA